MSRHCDVRRLYLLRYRNFGGGGSFGSAIGRDDVRRNARQRRRIRSGSNHTSSMKKHMSYIFGMAEKMRVVIITEGKCIIHKKN